jgi:hypothetical protein
MAEYLSSFPGYAITPSALDELTIQSFATGATSALTGGLIGETELFKDAYALTSAIQGGVNAALDSYSNGGNLSQVLRAAFLGMLISGSFSALAKGATNLSLPPSVEQDFANGITQLVDQTVSISVSAMNISALEYLRVYDPAKYEFIVGK